MALLLALFAWIAVGCAIAWLMGGAARVGVCPEGQEAPPSPFPGGKQAVLR